jgi:hypothetical protein
MRKAKKAHPNKESSNVKTRAFFSALEMGGGLLSAPSKSFSLNSRSVSFHTTSSSIGMSSSIKIGIRIISYRSRKEMH